MNLRFHKKLGSSCTIGSFSRNFSSMSEWVLSRNVSDYRRGLDWWIDLLTTYR
jgi:hypothetical protein